MEGLRVRLLRSGAKLPVYMTPGSAGMDISALLDEPVIFEPGMRFLVPTGIALAIPPEYEGQIRPRSGLAIKHGMTLVNSPGTIDSDYRGEIGVILINLGQERFELVSGQRIAQLVISPVIKVSIQEVSELNQSERGSGGFGHTGTGSLRSWNYTGYREGSRGGYDIAERMKGYS